MGESDEQATHTIPEFAALCREWCSRPAQGHDDKQCGDSYVEAGETVYAFCGWHWGAVIGNG
ncbi:MAG TPA: hypothetical protein VGB14_07635 [Acidimicrobiales bacterium]|jgi:hypothetical protein